MNKRCVPYEPLESLNIVVGLWKRVSVLRTLYTHLNQDTTLQDLHQTGSKSLTGENVATLNHLCALMQEVLADGKSLYGRSDKVKARTNYTLRQLLKRVRTERDGESEA